MGFAGWGISVGGDIMRVVVGFASWGFSVEFGCVCLDVGGDGIGGDLCGLLHGGRVCG